MTSPASRPLQWEAWTTAASPGLGLIEPSIKQHFDRFDVKNEVSQKSPQGQFIEGLCKFYHSLPAERVQRLLVLSQAATLDPHLLEKVNQKGMVYLCGVALLSSSHADTLPQKLAWIKDIMTTGKFSPFLLEEEREEDDLPLSHEQLQKFLTAPPLRTLPSVVPPKFSSSYPSTDDFSTAISVLRPDIWRKRGVATAFFNDPVGMTRILEYMNDEIAHAITSDVAKTVFRAGMDSFAKQHALAAASVSHDPALLSIMTQFLEVSFAHLQQSAEATIYYAKMGTKYPVALCQEYYGILSSHEDDFTPLVLKPARRAAMDTVGKRQSSFSSHTSKKSFFRPPARGQFSRQGNRQPPFRHKSRSPSRSSASSRSETEY